MAELTLLDGSEAGRVFSFSDGRVVLGRSEECALSLAVPGVSRQHAAIFRETDGGWTLEDLGSQNGTTVNGKTGKSFLLQEGDRICLGKVVSLKFSAAEEDSAETLPHLEEILREFSKGIVGQRKVAEQLLIALAAGGHCLMIGLPGLGKTLMVSTLSRILQLDFHRVQFTPDLMPSDIIGTDVLDIDENGRKSFRFIRGPVFTNLLLADEINRTPPKTQAALLEAMQERQVTASNQIFPLPSPFFVLATQNPLEQEGTYPLPEAQLDRFMFNILVEYPTAEEEEQIVMATTGKRDVHLEKILDARTLLAIQETVRRLPVSDHVVQFATQLVRRTRPSDPTASESIRKYVHCGAGPRAAQCLILGAKARAVLHGHANVSCEDVRELALPVLRHRIFTNFAADSAGITPDRLIRELLEQH